MSGKQSKLQMLRMEVAVKDRLIGALVTVVTDNEIKLPQHVIKILEAFYVNKKKNEEKETPQ